MAGVLEGIRVLDFGRYIAGPFCGTMLADLGAEVIRIEKLEGSEDRWVTPVAEGGEGAMFLQMGRNKLGLTLNPMKPAGREIVKKLVAASDVVIANLPYEDLKKMGIDYDTISAINPKIILATNSTFGSEGPYATRVGFDTIGQAMSGAMYLSGDGQVPTRANTPYVDFSSALLSTIGVLAALMDRAKSGKGQKVETALLRTAINIANGHLIEQAMLDLNRVATLNRGFTAGPSDTFKCKDGTDGRVANCIFIDNSSKIQMSFWDKEIDKHFENLKIGKAYIISQASVKTANKSFNPSGNNYELTCTRET